MPPKLQRARQQRRPPPKRRPPKRKCTTQGRCRDFWRRTREVRATCSFRRRPLICRLSCPSCSIHKWRSEQESKRLKRNRRIHTRSTFTLAIRPKLRQSFSQGNMSLPGTRRKTTKNADFSEGLQEEPLRFCKL